jgi:hypothetical protein
MDIKINDSDILMKSEQITDIIDSINSLCIEHQININDVIIICPFNRNIIIVPTSISIPVIHTFEAMTYLTDSSMTIEQIETEYNDFCVMMYDKNEHGIYAISMADFINDLKLYNEDVDANAKLEFWLIKKPLILVKKASEAFQHFVTAMKLDKMKEKEFIELAKRFEA